MCMSSLFAVYEARDLTISFGKCLQRTGKRVWRVTEGEAGLGGMRVGTGDATIRDRGEEGGRRERPSGDCKDWLA